MTAKELRIGFDFDGVLAYSPTRLIRAPISFIKKKIFKKKHLSFFIPKYRWQMTIWALVFGPSVLPEKGLDLFKRLINSRRLKTYLVTGRFDFLETSMRRWLKSQSISESFTSINVNLQREQPHQFKARLIKEHHLDYFIEDNWDTVQYLVANCPHTKILWIFNLVDKRIPYQLKFPYLEEALNYVVKENSL